MHNQVAVTCFTDLEGSTPLNESLGNESYVPALLEHLRVGKILAMRLGGEYIKDIGDAHMIRFDYLDSAMSFGLQLQEYYKVRPCIPKLPMKVRVSMYQGVIEPTNGDIFGTGVNRAARLQGETPPGQVVINKALAESLEQVWGPQKTAPYLQSIGAHDLKGIAEKQELFSFEWDKYAQAYPEMGLSKLVYNHLRGAKIEPSLVNVGGLSRPGIVIWPVVPRDLPTAIHKGQTEIVRLLALLGWRVKLLIADCGARINYNREYATMFSHKLETYAANRGISPIEILFLSDLYDPTYSEHSGVQTLFRDIASDLTLQDLLNINNKAYSENVKDEIKKSATLDCLRPALSLAGVLHLIEKDGSKGIVIAGADEKIQWERSYDIGHTREQLDVLMNPILKEDERYQTRQRRNRPIWPSQESLSDDMGGSNLAWWTYNLHAFMPASPAERVRIGDQDVSPQDWTDELQLPPKVQKEALVEHVWKLLNPAALLDS